MTKKRLPPPGVYRKRILKNACISLLFILFSLCIGIAGYMHFYELGWVDALLNASMILTGMGPVTEAKTDAAKIFASVYAIYSGVAFLTSVALLFSPIFHRFLHRFHLDIED